MALFKYIATGIKTLFINSEKHSSLFRRWLISYASVLLLPIIFCSFYYFHSYNEIKDRTTVNQHLVLNNFGEQINAVIYDALNVGNHLKINRYVTSLCRREDTAVPAGAPDSASVLARHFLRDDLKALRVANSLFSQISIYFPDSTYIVSSSSAYQTSLLPYMDQSYLSEEEWNILIRSLNASQLTFSSFEKQDALYIAQILYADLSENPQAVLCLQISKAQLLNRLQNDLFNASSCSFALIDDSSILLAADDRRILENLSPEYIYRHYSSDPDTTVWETSFTDANAADIPVIIDYCPLIAPNIRLISVIEQNIYRADLTRLLEIMFLTIGLCLLTGLIVILILSRKNYRPVSQIVSYIQGTENNVPNIKGNEYQFIMKILASNQNEIERQRILLKNNYLLKILNGEITYSQISDSVSQQFQLHLSRPFVCVITISSRDFGKLSSSEEGQNENGDNEQLLYFIIENVFRELLSPRFPEHHFCISRRHSVVLINIADNSPHLLQELDQISNELLAFLQRSYALSLYIGISSILQTEQITDAYLQAESALEYCCLFNSQQPCHYDTIPQNPAIGSISLNSSDYVINLVTSARISEIANYFQTIDRELKTRRFSRADAQSCYYFFYQTTARLRFYCQIHYSAVPEELNFLDDLFFSQPLHDALAEVCAAFTQAAFRIQKLQSLSTTSRWGNHICQYIENNYFDVNINLNSIAEYFQVSPAYLSRKFKEQYQKSVIDYLYEVRIAQALKLMRETSLKVLEIAPITGFPDSNAFIRIFKKYTGTTPGKYISLQKDPSTPSVT